jgi:O-acetyl-ADP-ribose deacetylase (regulator of RNase III)
MTKIEIIKGDITVLSVDAIVNAANSGLLGGGGVDGAIHRAGGVQILEDCKVIREKQGKLPTGGAVITRTGNLPARYVIHTVGPVWSGGARDEKVKLANCYQNSLQLAVENGCKTVAFPNVSTGVYGYPKQEAAEIAMKTVSDFLSKHSEIEKVIFCCFDDENYQIMNELIVGVT